jgi:predicted MFS family arabinose efflux permease
MKYKKKELALILTLSILVMSNMNIAPALNSISLAYPDIAQESIQLLIGLPALTTIISALCTGWLVVRTTKKKLLLAVTLAFVIVGSAPMVIDGFAFMLLSRAVIGVCLGVLLTTITAMIFEVFNDKAQRNTVIGWQNCAAALGNICVTAMAGCFTTISYKLAFAAHLIGLIPLAAIIFMMPDELQTQYDEANEVFASKSSEFPVRLIKITLPWLITTLFFTACVNTNALNISLLVEGGGMGTSVESGLGISLFTVGSFCTGLFFGKIMKIAKGHTINIGMLISASGLLSIAFAKSVVWIYTSSVFIGVGMALVIPYLTSRVVEKATQDEVTLASSLYNTSGNLGFCLSPYIVNPIAMSILCSPVSGRYIVSATGIAVMGVIIAAKNAKKRKNCNGKRERGRVHADC